MDNKLQLVLAIVYALWITFLCGGLAYLYWFTGFVDPRDVFGSVLGGIGAIMVFPVGWAYLLFWDRD
jgi:hypothetical protein